MIVLLGATGKVGRHLVAQLVGQGLSSRAIVRNAATAKLPGTVEVVHGDLSDPVSLEAHLLDAESVFLIWPFTSDQATANLAPGVVRTLARRVPTIVYLSAQAAASRPNSSWAQVERLIEEFGTDWTFLRPTGFASNTMIWAEQIRAGTVVRWPYGNAARSLIHERDIAAVAARTLTEKGHTGKKYILSGPEALTQIEQVRTIGEVIGRELHWDDLAPAEARQQLLAAWGDPSFVDSALATWASLVTDPEPVTSTVEQVTGSRSRPFREWVLEHVVAFGSAPAVDAD